MNVSMVVFGYSVMFFSVGVIASLLKEKGKNGLLYLLAANAIAVIITLILLGIIDIISLAHIEHIAINALILTAMIVVMSVWDISIAMPSAITVLSFDIYLVHRKVLSSMQQFLPAVEFTLFLALTIVATCLFYALRIHILQSAVWRRQTAKRN